MKRVLITRPRAQADSFGERLRDAGFEPIYFPMIEIKPVENNVALEQALSKLSCYEWAVFTSANAVDVVFDQFPSANWNTGIKVAAIGPKTTEALKARGVTPDFVPEEYVVEAILTGLGDLLGKWVLLPRAEIARKELPEAIFHAGGVPHEISVYNALPVQPNLDSLAVLKLGVDVITFTSASAVENFAAILRQNNLDPLKMSNNPLIACIGPITEQAARAAGFQNIVVAKEYTTEGLIKIISTLEAGQTL
jgi:uroporphyrinogen III methyltransferase / synthase